MKAVRLASGVAAVTVLCIALLLLVAPGSLLRPAANFLLGDYGIEVVAMQDLHLGWRQGTAAQVRLQLPGMSLTLQGLTVEHRVAELVGAGRIRSVAVQRADLVLAETEQQGSADPTQLPPLGAVLESVESLPFERLSVATLNIAGRIAARAELSIRARPLQLDAVLYPHDWPQWQAALQINQADTEQFNARFIVNDQARPIVTSDLVLRGLADGYALVIDSDLDLQAVQDLPPLAATAGTARIVNESLQITAELSAPARSSVGVFTLSRLQLATAESALQLETTANNAVVEASIPMPLSMQGSVNVTTARASVSLDALPARVSIASGLAAGEAELNATEVQLDCSFSGQCRGSLPFTLTLPEWKMAGVNVENAILSGELQIGLDRSLQQISAADLELLLTGVNHDLGSGSLRLAIEDLAVTAGDDLSASLRLGSRQLDFDLPMLEVINPAVSSTWSLHAGRLGGRGSVTVNRELQAEFSVQHDLATQAGQLSVDLPPLQFSNDRPLTRFVTLSALDADIIAGSLAGNGSLSWQSAPSGWQLSGPVSLDLQGLSGFAADLLFVDFTTSLEARYQDGRLQSSGLLPATVASVDVGLPMSRIDWDYSFDLHVPRGGDTEPPGVFTVTGLRTAVLGGAVEIPEFVYDLGAQSNRLRVVLSRLDLEEIVSLANYPELQVEGTVSGYLPLLVGPDGVALEDGLVSALQPGGSIRYTPATSTVGNASVELLNEALSNYLFDTLNAELEYTDNGDLEMAVQLRGRNPDMRGGQPINLNVNIANNVPEMLRSLQATRAITERLEQRLNNQ